MIINQKNDLLFYIEKILKEKKSILLDDLTYELLYNYTDEYVIDVEHFQDSLRYYCSLVEKINLPRKEKIKLAIQLMYKNSIKEFENNNKNHVILYVNRYVYNYLIKHKIKILKPSNIVFYEEKK